MTRIKPLDLTEISPSIKTAMDNHSNLYGEPVSAMQATLAHSLKTYNAYMQWYPLFESVEVILGKRMANLFAYAISKESECTYCMIVFRKKIIDEGEDPDQILFTPEERIVLDFGSAITKCRGNIANHIYNSVANRYTREEQVTLIAFAGQMIAANIFNNVVETGLDNHLHDYVPVAKSIW